MRKSINSARLFVLISLVAFLTGCSSLYDEVSYQAPNWTPEGLIYCQKSVTHYRKEPMGTITLGTDYYYVTMDIDGNNETLLPYDSYPYFSPKGTYAALIKGSTIEVIKRSDNQQVYKFSPTTESVGELDWGPDEDKLIFLTAKENLYIVNNDSTNQNLLTTECSNATWKYGNNIIYVTSRKDIYGRITAFNYSNNIENIFNNAKGLEPSVSSSNTLEVIYRNQNNIEKINLGNSNNTPDILFNNFIYAYIKLSPDATKLIAGKILNSGIWVINIDGSNLKQLK